MLALYVLIQLAVGLAVAAAAAVVFVAFLTVAVPVAILAGLLALGTGRTICKGKTSA